jgi:hypothetical protein
VVVVATPAPTPAVLPTASANPCPNFVADVVDGPSPAGDDFAAWEDVSRAQSRVAHDRAVLLAYADAHPSEFASFRTSIAPVRLVIGFTDHIAAHCLALRPLLEYPNEFRILHQGWTQDQLTKIRSEVGALAGGLANRLGVGPGYVSVELRADGESLAATILERYGAAVRIKVGLFAYPAPDLAPFDCGAWLTRPRGAGSLVAHVALRSSTVRSGRNFFGTVRIKNVGGESYDLTYSSLQSAGVFRPGTYELVGVYQGPGEGYEFRERLSPNESASASLLGGTASCDVSLGYSVAPGTYDVRAIVERLEPPLGTGGTSRVWFLSRPTPITVTP